MTQQDEAHMNILILEDFALEHKLIYLAVALATILTTVLVSVTFHRK